METLPTRLGLSIRTADTAMTNPTGSTQPAAPINIMGPSTLAPLSQPDADLDSDSKSNGRPVCGYEPQPGTSRSFQTFASFLNTVKNSNNTNDERPQDLSCTKEGTSRVDGDSDHDYNSDTDSAMSRREKVSPLPPISTVIPPGLLAATGLGLCAL